MPERPERSDQASRQAARVEWLMECTGVERWFRQELAVGLGAAYEQNCLYDVKYGTGVSDERYRQAFAEGIDWTIERGHGRFRDNPSKLAEMNRTMWHILGSDEQLQYMFDRFCSGRFHFCMGDSQETMGIFLVGDLDSFEYKKSPPAMPQAA